MPTDYGMPEEVKPLLNSLLAATPAQASGIADQPLDNVATHDFAFHEFIFDLTSPNVSGIKLSSLGEDYLASVSQTLDDMTISRLRAFLECLEAALTVEATLASLPSNQNLYLQLITDLYSRPTYVAFLFQIANEVNDTESLVQVLLAEILYLIFPVPIPPAGSGRTWDFVLSAAFPYTMMNPPSSEGIRQLEDEARLWTSVPSNPGRGYGYTQWWFQQTIWNTTASNSGVQPYAFEIAPPHSVNFGLRMTYRQFWRPLALQRGELVRTVPLGPGQKERVSTKIINRKKQSTSRETKKEFEASFDSTNTTKDSSEIVKETATSLKWDASVKGTYNGGVANGEASASGGGTAEDRSKNTSSFLSEAVFKSAAKMRTETKVVVSTESESTFEQERASEITNPNNEIAVTYEYYKLQQQHDVFTQLYRVEGVVYVAEEVPMPDDVNMQWVRRYDWILSRVLKDESFRPALDAASLDTDQDADPMPQGTDAFKGMLDAATNNFATFTTNSAASSITGNQPLPSLSIPDIYSKPQELYRQRLQDEAARIRSNALKAIQRQRLLQHLRDNILYYCRAIWAEEDRDQRLLRYRKERRTVPSEWISGITLPTSGSIGKLDGWVPTGATVPLESVIDLTGPLDYVGNYSIWALKPSDNTPKVEFGATGFLTDFTVTVNIAGLLMWAKAPYVDSQNGGLLDPALVAARRDANALTSSQLAALTDEQVQDFLSYFPNLSDQLVDNVSPFKSKRNGSGALTAPPTAEQWAQYLYRSNGTRRFLVDTDTVYLALRVGEGAALEPFKRVHRYLDVLRAAEGLQTDQIKNQRRTGLIANADAFDPDIDKVVVVGSGATAAAVAGIQASGTIGGTGTTPGGAGPNP